VHPKHHQSREGQGIRHWMPPCFFKKVFRWDWSLKSGLCTCKAGARPLELHLHSILYW
jgi:hypothetical protein